MSAQHPRICLHVGYGKTGTSSIQRTLSENAHDLGLQGAVYLGYMLENCKRTHLIDKPALGLDLFRDKEPREFASLLLDVLWTEVEEARGNGMTRLIWSNESILARPAHILPALTELRSRGVPVEVHCYLRRHDAWAQSAYFQWGIKHKTYSGPVQPFQVWATKWRFAFAPAVAPWLAELQDDFRLYNYSAHPDVVEHFLEVNGLKLDTIARENEPRSPEELLLWSAFNSSFEPPTLPSRLEPLLVEARRRAGEFPSLPSATSLFPTREDLLAVQQRSRADIAAINEILLARAEPPLDFSSDVRTISDIDRAGLSDLLFRVFLLAYREAYGVVDPADRLIASEVPGGLVRVEELERLQAQVDALKEELELAQARARPSLRNLTSMAVRGLLTFGTKARNKAVRHIGQGRSVRGGSRRP